MLVFPLFRRKANIDEMFSLKLLPRVHKSDGLLLNWQHLRTIYRMYVDNNKYT